MRSDRNHVVVIGAGLAGLAAAATAARAGAAVTLLDSRSPGGRARTDNKDGFLLNQGPHALYKGGPGRKVLARLGLRPSGHNPPLRGSRGLAGGQARSLLTSPQAIQIIARVTGTDPKKWAGRTTREWIDGMGWREEAAALTEALVRVTTYVADMDRLPADLALTQMRSGLLRGVSYLDGGWATLVDGLAANAGAAGATVLTAAPASRIDGGPGRWEVVTTSGKVLEAAAVVIAAGSPAAVRALLPVEDDWGDLGPEVTAACLDLGLRGRPPKFLLGVDEPLYFSPHCPPGDLAPAGHGLVQVMRYGARDAHADHAELSAFAATAGVCDENVVIERFLARMVVTHMVPSPERGLDGRPRVAVDVDEADGLFIAGDWVGPVGWLADAALASGEEAGKLAATVAGRQRPRSRVA